MHDHTDSGYQDPLDPLHAGHRIRWAREGNRPMSTHRRTDLILDALQCFAILLITAVVIVAILIASATHDTIDTINIDEPRLSRLVDQSTWAANCGGHLQIDVATTEVVVADCDQ